MEGLLDARLRAVVTRAADYDWCVSEFVRVTGSLLPSRSFLKAAPELRAGARTPAGTPVRVQLLGSDPERLAQNAARLLELGPAGIDLNFGCPAPQVNRHRGGAVLLAEPTLLHDIARAVSVASEGRVPVTAKMRLGIRDTSLAIEAAQALAEGGAQMLVVHARTRDQGYRPPAHWAWVARIAAAVRIPVVANGEIWTLDDYLRCRAESGLVDVMLGRGALADPFLASRIRDWLAGRQGRREDDAWPRLQPLLVEYWQRVRLEVAPRHAPGRLKQWLNLLQKHFPEADRLFRTVRGESDPAAIDVTISALEASAAAGAPMDHHQTRGIQA
jgi:tRNA-dihydrouridine synthase C